MFWFGAAQEPKFKPPAYECYVYSLYKQANDHRKVRLTVLPYYFSGKIT